MGNCAQPPKSTISPKTRQLKSSKKAIIKSEKIPSRDSSLEKSAKRIPESEMENTLGLQLSYDSHDPVMLKIKRYLNAHVKLGDDDDNIGIRWKGDGASILVEKVTFRTPAWTAGVEPGLRLIDINSTEIKTKDELKVAMAQLKLQRGGCIKLSRTYSPSDVSEHKSSEDCWIVINGNVYDVTNYVKLHPGGAQILLSRAGTDATAPFEKLRHSVRARTILDDYCIGCLVKQKHSDSSPMASFPSDTETL